MSNTKNAFAKVLPFYWILVYFTVMLGSVFSIHL